MAVTVQWYNHFLEVLGDGSLDMDNDTFKCALLDTNHVFDATDTVWADVSANEIAAAFGYTANGVALTNVVWQQTAGVVKFDFDDPSWTAAGGSIETAYHAVIYSSTGNELLCSIGFGEGKTAEDGADLNILIPAAGLFTIA